MTRPITSLGRLRASTPCPSNAILCSLPRPLPIYITNFPARVPPPDSTSRLRLSRPFTRRGACLPQVRLPPQAGGLPAWAGFALFCSLAPLLRTPAPLFSTSSIYIAKKPCLPKAGPACPPQARFGGCSLLLSLGVFYPPCRLCASFAHRALCFQHFLSTLQKSGALHFRRLEFNSSTPSLEPTTSNLFARSWGLLPRRGGLAPLLRTRALYESKHECAKEAQARHGG